MMTEEERDARYSGWGDYYKDMTRFQANKITSNYTQAATELAKPTTVSVELKTEKENPPTGLNKSPFEELSTKIEELEKQTEALKKQIDALSTAFDVAMARLNAKITRLEIRQQATVTYEWASAGDLTGIQPVKYETVSRHGLTVSSPDTTDGC